MSNCPRRRIAEQLLLVLPTLLLTALGGFGLCCCTSGHRRGQQACLPGWRANHRHPGVGPGWPARASHSRRRRTNLGLGPGHSAGGPGQIEISDTEAVIRNGKISARIRIFTPRGATAVLQAQRRQERSAS